MNQQVFEKLAKELDGTTGRRMEIKNCPVCGQPLKKKGTEGSESFGDVQDFRHADTQKIYDI